MSNPRPHVNWGANKSGDIVISLRDFAVRYVGSLMYDTPAKGYAGYQLVYVPSGVVLNENIDITFVVRKAIMEQSLLEFVQNSPTYGVGTAEDDASQATDDILSSFKAPTKPN
jgi:hypothetical protein